MKRLTEILENILQKDDINTFFDKCYTSPGSGNKIAFVKGKDRTDSPLMLCAHRDKVRFIVNHISKEGFLKLSPVGGISSSVCFGRRLEFFPKSGEKIYGVTSAKATHLLSSEEKSKYPSGKNIWADIGVNSKEEAEKIINLGDIAVFENTYIKSGDRIFAGAIDDLAGCAILLELMESLLPFDTWFVFTDNEEIGLVGGHTALYNVCDFARDNGYPIPKIAIITEATTAADIPGVSGAEKVCRVKKGAVISYMDRSTLYEPKLYKTLTEIALKNNIKFQTKTLIAGGNDAGAIHKSMGGIITSAVSIPTRYIHSPVSSAALCDIYAVRNLLFAAIEKLSFVGKK